MTSNGSQGLEPAIIVIFGITGDLSHRYLLPSLYHLFKGGLLNPETEILGITRGDTATEKLFGEIEKNIRDLDNGEFDEAALKAMQARTSMMHMDLDDPKSYSELKSKLDSIEEQKGLCMNRLYYLSIPPRAHKSVVHLLGEGGLNLSCAHDKAESRLLIEKPFGYDLESAKELITETTKVFKEEQIFRIDHYMAKETVQNILAFRFENPIFEAIWNKDCTNGIDIYQVEENNLSGRGVFYDPLGALRDIIQNHLLQILAIVTMDQPDEFNSESIHAKKQALLEQVEPVPASEVASRTLRGQYRGYKEDVNNPESTTETYAAITIFINSPRWQGVPIRLRTGKALNERKAEVSLSFHGRESGTADSATGDNHLRFRIQPNEGIELELNTKKPGFGYEVEPTTLDFSYATGFAGQISPNAYERVLVDAIKGDRTLFATSEEVLLSWKIVQPVLDAWYNGGPAEDLAIYEPGSSGP